MYNMVRCITSGFDNILIEPFNYNDTFSQFILPAHDSINKALQFLNNKRVNYNIQVINNGNINIKICNFDDNDEDVSVAFSPISPIVHLLKSPPYANPAPKILQ